MSAISQKSISGITSITSPAGTDDQISLHTSNTNEALKIDGAGNLHIHNHVNTTGISSASNFKTGSSNLHSTGLTVGDTFVHSTGVNGSSMDVDDFISVGSNIHLGNAGVITATSFIGDGSDLTNLPAGLGTALSATASSPLNKMYYTNQVLGVPSSVTVDVPASASKAYTQYADIKVESSADLIIADGDDLIPDVLGLADFGTFGGGASAGRIRVNSISNAANDGSPTVQKGLVVTGVTTSTTFSGSGASLTNLPSAQLTGALPAIDGSNLTGISGVTINSNADNRIITGSGTAATLNGESTLTYSGDTLLSTNSNFVIKSIDTNAGNSENYIQFNAGYITYDSDSSNSTGYSGHYFQADGAEKLRINGSGQLIFDADTNTHIARPAADTFAFTTGGTERLRIDSSGRLLVSGQAALTSTSLIHPVQITANSSAENIVCFGRASDDISAIDFYEADKTTKLGEVQYRTNQLNIRHRSQGADINFATTASGGSVSDKMTIDSAGRVSKSYQPFAMVHIQTQSGRSTTGSQIVVPWDIIHTNSTSSNVGNHFNTSNHRFTAPINGRYLFVVSLNIVGDNIVYHRINGTNRHGGEYRMTQLVWDHADTSFIYDMNANDYYDTTSQLYNGSGSRFNGGANSGFGWDCLSIYLLG